MNTCQHIVLWSDWSDIHHLSFQKCFVNHPQLSCFCSIYFHKLKINTIEFWLILTKVHNLKIWLFNIFKNGFTVVWNSNSSFVPQSELLYKWQILFHLNISKKSCLSDSLEFRMFIYLLHTVYFIRIHNNSSKENALHWSLISLFVLYNCMYSKHISEGCFWISVLNIVFKAV